MCVLPYSYMYKHILPGGCDVGVVVTVVDGVTDITVPIHI